MEMSENIAALSTALATAQATLGGAVKDKANPVFKSKYADLGSVWDAWQDHQAVLNQYRRHRVVNVVDATKAERRAAARLAALGNAIAADVGHDGVNRGVHGRWPGGNCI